MQTYDVDFLPFIYLKLHSAFDQSTHIQLIITMNTAPDYESDLRFWSQIKRVYAHKHLKLYKGYTGCCALEHSPCLKRYTITYYNCVQIYTVMYII